MTAGRCISIGARRQLEISYEDAHLRALCEEASEPALHPGAFGAAHRKISGKVEPARCMPRRWRIIPISLEFDVYASGPPVMVETIRHEFLHRGLPPEQLFFDSFDYAPDALAKRGNALIPK